MACRHKKLDLVPGGYSITNTGPETYCGSCHNAIKRFQPFLQCFRPSCRRFYHWQCVSEIEREYIICGSLDKHKWCCLNFNCIADLALGASDDYYCAQSFLSEIFEKLLWSTCSGLWSYLDFIIVNNTQVNLNIYHFSINLSWHYASVNNFTNYLEFWHIWIILLI